MIDLDVNSMYPRTMAKTPAKFHKLSTAIVDGEQWFSMIVNSIEIAEWIRSNNKDLWAETLAWSSPKFGTFDMHEKLYMMLELRYG